MRYLGYDYENTGICRMHVHNARVRALLVTEISVQRQRKSMKIEFYEVGLGQADHRENQCVWL